MRLFRLFQLLDELRLRRTAVSARTLAADMGVSVRTLYRDIADLQALGAPIRGEGGVGYILEPGLFMPSLRLDQDELSALALGLRMVAVRTDADMSEAARRAASKIASAVGEAARLEFLDSALEAGPTAMPYQAFFGVLRDAIRQRRVIEIGYTSLADKVSTRLARPLGLTVFDSAWLLTIWCESAEDFRHLRVDRIHHVLVTERRFKDERGRRFADCLALEEQNLRQFCGDASGKLSVNDKPKGSA
ncbi:helix-turn-helix transcriptional regulator [Bowmanella yangjiangensis]|uniref:helix-turn-helix transcriptional regulator n=1 Tax=Bowmanella yangjiangensis TaxID=2811230 RepID=UPI001E4FAA0F|nr:YafY family protein [Bowmanella yangjiangensis]